MSLIDIIIPSESNEGTTMKVQAWLKQPGDPVSKNEPIVEMETDKVTLEIEAPVDGVLSEILVSPSADVKPDMIIGRIITEATDIGGVKPTTDAINVNSPIMTSSTMMLPTTKNASFNMALSPSVRRFVLKHEIDVSQILGTGKRNRITLNDVKRYLSRLATSSAKDLVGSTTLGASRLSRRKATPELTSSIAEVRSHHVPHSSMRRSIAEHMSSSVSEAPHVTAIFEADFSAIAAHRTKHQEDFAARGVKLTYTAYFLMACADAMKTVPEINSQWHADSVEVFSDVNIGVGTALGDKGLVAPVINGVQERSLFGVAKELQDITIRARNQKLKPSDMRGGTFTISNHGVSGSLVATPIIINQPQSAILGVGKLEKRVVVRSLEGQDVMLIRPMAYVSLTIDHRVIDGYQTNAWLSAFVARLEHWVT